MKDIAQLARDLAEGRTTSEALVKQALARIEAHREAGGVAYISVDARSALLNGSVKPGERIVTAGVNSLKPGQKVKIDEDSPR